MRRAIFMAVWAAGGVAASLAACFDFGGLENAPDASANDATSDASPSDASPTACPSGCAPTVPSGWLGPSVVYNGPPSTKPTECPAPYGQRQVDGFEGMTAPSAQCECGTAVLAGASCSAHVQSWSATGCAGSVFLEGTIAVPGNDCVTTNDTGYLKVTSPVLDAGSCTYPSPTVTLPDASVTTEDLACGLPQDAVACAGSASCITAPAPEAPFTKLCIHKSGDVGCPNADYAQRFVTYLAVNDTRGCSACAASPSGGTCGTSWGTSSSLINCAASPPTGFTTDTCAGGPYTAGAIVGGAIGPNGVTCTKTSGGTPQGAATLENPITFCCSE